MWETQLRVNNLHKGVAQRRKSNREAISASRKGKDKNGNEEGETSEQELKKGS